MALRIIGCIVLGWLFGGLNGAIIVSRVKLHEDVREKGSGNAGATNFLRTYGGWMTLLVFVIDLAKTFAACFLATLILPQMPDLAKILAGFAAQIGHIFPVFFGLHGGKGITCIGAVAIMMDWRVMCIGLSVFLLIFFLTRYVSLASILGSAVCAVLYMVFYWEQPWVWIIGIAMSALGIFMHRSNIKRLLHGTERKTHFHRSKNEEGAQ